MHLGGHADVRPTPKVCSATPTTGQRRNLTPVATAVSSVATTTTATSVAATAATSVASAACKRENE